MTDERQSSDAAREDDERRSGGAIGTVFGATLGPFGAAVATVVDDTRFAIEFSMGGAGTAGRSGEDDRTDAGAGGTDADATTIEIEDVGTVDADDLGSEADDLDSEADDLDSNHDAADESAGAASEGESAGSEEADAAADGD